MKVLWAIFIGVFLAELGDKTQLATMCFAADKDCSKLGVFVAASAALVCSTLLAVLVGSQITRFVPAHYIKATAGLVFVVIGVVFIWGAFKA